MKKTLAILLVLILSLTLVGIASADAPAPGGPFSTAFRVQNLGASDADCSYTFYDALGSAEYTADTGANPVAPGDSLYVYVPDLTLDSGSYSGVVSCSEPVAAVANFSDADSGAAHAGVAAPGTTWYAPGIYNDYYDFYSNVYVQNATGSAVDVTVEIYEAGNATPVATQTATDVPAYASATFEQEGLAGLDAGETYSAKITATGNVAPIVNIYGLDTVDNQLYSYNPFTAGSFTAYVPLVMNNYYGYNTSVNIQNIGTGEAAVTVTYTDGTVDNYSIGSNAAVSLYTPNILPAGDVLYGATITSDEPIVVLVNESTGYNRAASYTAFAGGSTEVRAPIVMNNYYAFNTSVTCQNIGADDTDMTITYSDSAATSTGTDIAVGDTHLFYQPADGLADGYIGSAVITASENIVCVANEDMNMAPEATTIMDQLYSYEGIAP